ncbi:MAG: hypothetical protein OXC69_04875 [Candidatus Tectomicrobia bacterium]|nr:hypothetical protein [Candidatus Tectomicrobia bacterium]
MKSGTPKTSKCLSLALGLLVLAGMVSGAGPALAQPDCPLPDGVTPPAAPRVTAQEVEDGNAGVAAFALAMRDGRDIWQGDETVTFERWIYFGCLLRQEGSPWRSGSTYFVELTIDGRVFAHAKDMSLSGRQLKPAIYGAILHALGIDPAALTDPAAARAAFAAAADGDGALFDVPEVPGASGHASADSFSASLLLAGFDLDSSHLTEEQIDHLEPVVTASDVVDRATLKAFVMAAGEYAIELLTSRDPAAQAKARVVLRDPNGPWRHGPVYLAAMERASKLILFHGAFPDRFEFRLGGIARDAATGELIVDQLIAAAESGMEGGFWLYHFDDPADDTVSADVPKVGYARVFTGQIPLPDGSTLSMDVIVNSGFYLTSDSEFVQRLLESLEDGQTSILFGITTPEDGDVVAGDAVAVSVTGAPTDTVHFAYRPAGLPEEEFTYLGAAANRATVASFSWNTLDIPDDDYELVALYTEDDGYSVIYDNIEVSVDNVGDGGCAALPVPPGEPLDPTLTVLVGLLMIYLTFGRLRPMRQAAMG